MPSTRLFSFMNFQREVEELNANFIFVELYIKERGKKRESLVVWKTSILWPFYVFLKTLCHSQICEGWLSMTHSPDKCNNWLGEFGTNHACRAKAKALLKAGALQIVHMVTSCILPTNSIMLVHLLRLHGFCIYVFESNTLMVFSQLWAWLELSERNSMPTIKCSMNNLIMMYMHYSPWYCCVCSCWVKMYRAFGKWKKLAKKPIITAEKQARAESWCFLLTTNKPGT